MSYMRGCHKLHQQLLLMNSRHILWCKQWLQLVQCKLVELQLEHISMLVVVQVVLVNRLLVEHT